ncbi:MAG: hypothetical protein R2856_09525 [Caldilineaceae bacterium]
MTVGDVTPPEPAPARLSAPATPSSSTPSSSTVPVDDDGPNCR